MFRIELLGGATFIPTLISQQKSPAKNAIDDQFGQGKEIRKRKSLREKVCAVGSPFRAGSPSSSPVRTPPFHGENRGSNPRGDAIYSIRASG